MRIDQRNAGASVTLDGSGVYPIDRFRCDEDTDGTATGQRVTDAPSGFTNSLKITTTSTDASLTASQYVAINHFIEGFNTSDLAFGTASAKTITISFWVKSSLTGTFAGGIDNNAGNRSYVFNYTISTADTWENKTITILGDTSGTWLTDNSRGIGLRFSLGAGSDFDGTVNSWQSGSKFSSSGAVSIIGTLNATFYITGVQLEAGSTATDFERRPIGAELSMCQRYYYELPSGATNAFVINAGQQTSTNALGTVYHPVDMRIAPTLGVAGTTAAYYTIVNSTTVACTSLPAISAMSSPRGTGISIGASASVGFASWIAAATSAGKLSFSSEL
jgi:hypothetical protein